MHLMDIISQAGMVGIWVSVFAESGLLVFFMPGDSLLFMAGFLASKEIFDVWAVSAGSFLASAVGSSITYYVGNRLGHRVSHKKYNFFIKAHHLKKADQYYQHHGNVMVAVSRFIPVIRTFIPLAAGVSGMKYRHFLAYSLLGCAAWGFGLPVLGYTLGNRFPDIDRYLYQIVAIIIFISLLPSLLHRLKKS